MAALLCADPEVLRKLATPTRNRYFYGKLLDTFHFELEQNYGNRKRWLLNRLTLGSGVVCGLSVAITNDGKSVLVQPGVAIDQLGREIVVPAVSIPVDPRQPTDACGRPVGDRVPGAAEVTLCLAYHECAAEPMPAFVAGCEGEKSCESSAIRERYCLLIHTGTPPAITLGCGFPNLFTPPEGGGTPQVHPPLVSRVSQACPEVSGEVCVVLAKITLPEGEAPLTPEMIDPNFRPLVYSNNLLFELLFCLAEQSQSSAPAPPLTTISALSWTHDGAITIAEFMNGLTVTFSGRVTTRPREGRAWFVVTVEYPVLSGDAQPQGTIVVQHVLAETITIQTNETQAFFLPRPNFLDAFQNMREPILRGSGVQPLCRVMLKCDFLVDGGGNPVDGDFLRGQLPSTGDGIPGGVFESWFRINLQ